MDEQHEPQQEGSSTAMLERALEKYPPALDPEQVAEVLGVTRRYVDNLLREGKLDHFVLDPTKQRLEKRVNKAALIAFMLNAN